MRAWLNLRLTVPARVAVFRAGLQALGYSVQQGITYTPEPGDLLVTWNRIHVGNAAAQAFDARGLPVLVTENATWGNDFAGERWYTLARRWHNMAGCFPVGGPERFDSLGVELAPWRTSGEVVGLLQRGFGANGMPRGWLPPGCDRIRAHPGQREAVPLEKDLERAGRVVTWGSGAAVKALLWGIPVQSHMPGWIGEQDNTDAGRLAMLRRLAWAQWTLAEIERGEPFRRLLCESL